MDDDGWVDSAARIDRGVVAVQAPAVGSVAPSAFEKRARQVPGIATAVALAPCAAAPRIPRYVFLLLLPKCVSCGASSAGVSTLVNSWQLDEDTVGNDYSLLLLLYKCFFERTAKVCRDFY